jgi:hypothetical protein
MVRASIRVPRLGAGPPFRASLGRAAVPQHKNLGKEPWPRRDILRRPGDVLDAMLLEVLIGEAADVFVGELRELVPLLPQLELGFVPSSLMHSDQHSSS